MLSFYPLQKAIPDIRKSVLSGLSFYESMEVHPIFPKQFTQIIKVGEQTATLGRTTSQLAESLEAESEVDIARLTQFLEPVLIVVLGAMVALILVAMYLPMFELSKAMGS